MVKKLAGVFLMLKIAWQTVVPFLLLIEMVGCHQVLAVLMETEKLGSRKWKIIKIAYELQKSRGWIKMMLICLKSGGFNWFFQDFGFKGFLMSLQVEFWLDRKTDPTNFQVVLMKKLILLI